MPCDTSSFTLRLSSITSPKLGRFIEPPHSSAKYLATSSFKSLLRSPNSVPSSSLTGSPSKINLPLEASSASSASLYRTSSSSSSDESTDWASSTSLYSTSPFSPDCRDVRSCVRSPTFSPCDCSHASGSETFSPLLTALPTLLPNFAAEEPPTGLVRWFPCTVVSDAEGTVTFLM